MKHHTLVLITVALVAATLSHAEVQVRPRDDIYDALNALRGPLGAIPKSDNLTALCMEHVKALFADMSSWGENNPNCNSHSWPKNNRASLSYKSCCFNERVPSSSSCMTEKGKETQLYSAEAFEIIAYTTDMSATADTFTRLWQSSPPHYNVIVNRAPWQNHKWNALGVASGQDGNKIISCAWFGETEASTPRAVKAEASTPREVKARMPVRCKNRQP